jgi:trehalose 6-phosphate phosphatase
MKRSGKPRRAAQARVANALPVAQAQWAYFFDIDGTLVDFTTSPSGVRLDRNLRQVLERLHRSAGGALALISGRSIADIDRLFPGARLPVAGQHGIERRDALGRVMRHGFPSKKLLSVRRTLADAAARNRGLLLEDKGLSLALHYRRVPRLGGFAHRLVRSLLAQVGTEFCVQSGKRVIEMKPTGWHKGIAVLEFMQEEPFRGRTPVFIGDDVTDEYGFAAVNCLDGYSVKVGPGRTVARWRLQSARAVRAWLERGTKTASRESRQTRERAL